MPLKPVIVQLTQIRFRYTSQWIRFVSEGVRRFFIHFTVSFGVVRQFIDHFPGIRVSGVDHLRVRLLCSYGQFALIGWLIVVQTLTLCWFSVVIPTICRLELWRSVCVKADGCDNWHRELSETLSFELNVVSLCLFQFTVIAPVFYHRVHGANVVIQLVTDHGMVKRQSIPDYPEIPHPSAWQKR